ncbi:alpha-L-rhamnosidase [Dysgonomonas sp. Marseille-P4677]|uniref:alpha-L-rhamnosidase-related protein n=1 Tax=Dysgonomonas sp. Marseille-P4677 TaxID=2364790 RepID=UPI0019143CA2|nr:alpha-L-rhamnosidase C-terminal domain-containing protein [Dysgonomonas sp. Marseille-P4677]MBK5719606.1 alpha-L-rhamnosidase [Dysgonomonas sp. Marseille-P4677]
MNIKRFILFFIILGNIFFGTSYAQSIRHIEETSYNNPWQKDEMIVSYITPSRIMWTSDTSGRNVRAVERLLKPFSGQVAVNSEEICVLSTKDGGSASILLDFGKEFQGGIQIAAAIRGTQAPIRVRIRLGESVSEAMSDVDTSSATNDHAMRDFITYIPWLGTMEIGESGFRFARIDLIDKDVDLPLAAVRAAFRYRDIPYLGSFKSSDERLNNIWQMGAYTVHLNMQNYLWDGIKRDRLVWLGDLHPEVMTVNSVFGDQNVVKKSLDFARDNTPLPGWMNGMCSYSLWWIIIHCDLYNYQGDYNYLKQQYPYLEGLVEQVIRNIDGNKENLHGGTRFLDWPTSENPDVIHAGLQAMTILSLEAATEIAGWLDDKNLANTCNEAVKRLREYVPNHKNNKQAASLLALAGILNVQDAEKVVSKNGANGFSTFYGYYMLESLAKAGKYDKAMEIISDYWGGMLDLGATTFWEDLTFSDLEKASRIDEFVPVGKYDIHADGGAYCYKGLRHSFCHGWASGPTPWLSRYVLGIYPLEPGFKKVEIKPHLGNLKWVEGTFPTPHGMIKVKHEKLADGTIKTDVDAPEGMQIVR